jgi:hypothetical protein
MRIIVQSYLRMIPYLPFLVLACAAIVAAWHISVYW